jgi:hypothetical protein
LDNVAKLKQLFELKIDQTKKRKTEANQNAKYTMFANCPKKTLKGFLLQAKGDYSERVH